MIIKAFKYRLYPNKEQITLLSKHFGCVRYIYNWALNSKIEAYKTEKKYENFISLGNKLPKLKEEFEWLKEINAQSLQSAIKNVDNAFKHFFKDKKGFPKFKSKKRRKDSFHIPQSFEFNLEKSTISIPKIKEIKCIFSRKFTGKTKTATISRTPSNKYFVSILVETEDNIIQKQIIEKDKTLGIDVGIKTYVTLSSGEKIDNPKHLKTSQYKLKYQQYILSKQDTINKEKKIENSKKREKQRLKVSRLHEKITNQRNDFLHKLTYKLTHDNQVNTLVVEDLSVTNMMKNHCLAGSIQDASWGKFFEFLKYKCEWYGKNLLTIGRFEPSSKMCNSCGHINKELTLKDRVWVCEGCSKENDRDYNASMNIRDFGILKQNKIPLEERELTPMETGTVVPSTK